METPMIMKVLTLIGLPGYIAAFLVNIGTIKGDILFIVALGIMIVRFGFYCWKTWQIIRMNEIEIQERQKALAKKK